MNHYDNDDDNKCMRCPWNRKRVARNDRWLTLGDPIDGVTLHFRLCNPCATRFDNEWNVWVCIGEAIEGVPDIEPAAAAPTPAPVCGRENDANQRLLALTAAAAERKAAQVKRGIQPSVADTWRFTEHVVERMRERGYDDKQVLRAVLTPEKVVASRRNPACEYRVSGDCCVVVNPSQRSIITVHDKFTMMMKNGAPLAASAARKGA